MSQFVTDIRDESSLGRQYHEAQDRTHILRKCQLENELHNSFFLNLTLCFAENQRAIFRSNFFSLLTSFFLFSKLSEWVTTVLLLECRFWLFFSSLCHFLARKIFESTVREKNFLPLMSPAQRERRDQKSKQDWESIDKLDKDWKGDRSLKKRISFLRFLSTVVRKTFVASSSLVFFPTSWTSLRPWKRGRLIN